MVGVLGFDWIGPFNFLIEKIEPGPRHVKCILKMLTYNSSNTETAMKTDAYIRQNPWGKVDNVFDSLLQSKRLHAPWAHTKAAVDQMALDGNLIGHGTGTQYINVFKNLAIGSLVLVPNGAYGRIVRVKSAIKSGIIETLCIACHPRTCDHNHITACDVCRNSIVEVFDPSNAKKLVAHLKAGNLIEPFYSAYRDIEYVANADFGVDARSIAGPNSAGAWVRYWKEVQYAPNA
jgi:hypothetical protein